MSSIVVPATWTNRMCASPTYQKHLGPLVKDPSNQKILEVIADDCIREMTRFFSVDFALDLKIYYDADLHSKCVRDKQLSPRDVLVSLNENTLSLFIRPRKYTNDNRADVVLYVVECIVRSLLQFLFPNTNQATLDYYTTILIFDRIFRIGMIDTEKQEMRQQIANLRSQEIKEIPQFKRDHSLSCPHCRSRSIELLGIHNTGSVEFHAGVPILGTKTGDMTIMAYYKCDECKRVFYAQPEETPEAE